MSITKSERALMVAQFFGLGTYRRPLLRSAFRLSKLQSCLLPLISLIMKKHTLRIDGLIIND